MLAILTLLPLAGSLAGGCGSGGSTVASNERTTVSSTKSVGGLTLTLSEDTASIAAGQSVNYTLTVTNTSNSAVTYVPEETPGIPAIISGTTSFVTAANDVGTTPLQIPATVSTGTNFSIYDSPVTLAPGATITGTVSSGTEINQPGIYSTTATVHIAVGDLDAAEAGSDTLLSAGPLGLTVR